jgi:hypothetical protein
MPRRVYNGPPKLHGGARGTAQAVVESLSNPSAALNELKGFFQDITGIWNNGDVATGLRTKGKRAFETLVKFLPVAGAPGYAAAVALEALQVDKVIELLATLVDLITGKASFIQFFNVMKDFIGDIFKRIGDFVLSALPQVGAALSGAANAIFGGLSGRGKDGYEQIEDKKSEEMVGGARGTAQAVVESLMDPYGTLEEIKGFFRDLVGIWNNGDVANGLRTKGKKAFLTLIRFLPLAGAPGYAAAVAMERLQLDKIIDLLADLIDLITGKKSLGDFFNSLKQFIGDVYEKIRDLAMSLFPAVGAAITEVANKIKDGIIQVSGQIRDGITNAANKVAEGATNAINTVSTGINNAAQEVSREVNKGAENFVREMNRPLIVFPGQQQAVDPNAANAANNARLLRDQARIREETAQIRRERAAYLELHPETPLTEEDRIAIKETEFRNSRNNTSNVLYGDQPFARQYTNEDFEGMWNKPEGGEFDEFATWMSENYQNLDNGYNTDLQDQVNAWRQSKQAASGSGKKRPRLLEHVSNHMLKRARDSYDERFF